MKALRTKSGPFTERPHFDPSEIDRICADELRKQGLPKLPEAIRIERFVEKRFGVVPQCEDLAEGVLGFLYSIQELSQQIKSRLLSAPFSFTLFLLSMVCRSYSS